MEDRVREILDKVRPSLQAHGGDVELVEVTADGIVRVRLKGACAACPLAQLTLSKGVEKQLKDAIPEVKAVEAVD